MSSPPALDFNNVQGDILVGLPKKTQTYVFFQIDDDVTAFRKALAKLVPLITTTAQVQDDRSKISQNKKTAGAAGTQPPLLELSGVNIALSHTGLVKIGITDEIGDSAFDAGQFADSKNLGDQGTTDPTKPTKPFTPNWVPAFKNAVHGVILISGESHATVNLTLEKVETIFSVGSAHATIHEVLKIVGDVRPGKEKGHEHFGFLDGISQPAVQGVDNNPNPGQETVSQGIILLGRDGDAPILNKQPVTRPPWALDGSFLVLRYLFQLVPEFNKFLQQNPITATGLPPAEGSELLGARLVGRWKSGAPVDITPLQDDPSLGADPSKNNNFRYDFPDDSQTEDRCPFAAHTRKTNPRADLEDHNPPFPTEIHRIIRRGVQFGPEVTKEEAASGKTKYGRGLIFVAYQSNIVNGFQFIQESWANSTVFPFGKPTNLTPGFDPIIGQADDPTSRTLSGTDPTAQTTELKLPTQWVVPRGGEYFFSPSISALRDTLSLSS